MISLNTLMRPAFILTLALIAAGCAPFAQLKPSGDAVGPKAQTALYDESLALMEAGQHAAAAQRLGTLLASEPRGDDRSRAMLALAYSQLKLGQPERAAQLASRVIAHNTQNSPQDYALYLRASALLAAQPAQTPDQARQAALDLENLGRHYPDSRYATATRETLAGLRERLAATELEAARQQLQDRAYAAALNRCRYLIERYPGTRAVPAALELMVTAYRKLGLDQLADNTSAILQGRTP